MKQFESGTSTVAGPAGTTDRAGAAPATAGRNDPGHIQDTIERGLKHLWIHTRQLNELREEGEYVVVESGQGIWLNDTTGKRYIDALSGLWVVAVGHGRHELADVAAAQMRELPYINPFAYANGPAIDLATRLAELTPPHLTRTYFVNTGAEAVETALRMAKQFQYNRGEKGRFKVISRVGSYHGMTMGALSVNGGNLINRAPFEPLVPGNIPVPNVNGIGKLDNARTGLDDMFWADYVEEMVHFHGAETIAAFIAEPISTANGNHLPSKAYWARIRQICDDHGIVLIADEIINGCGRTGRWFACEHFDLRPDIMTLAKQLSSGYAPIAAVVASERISDGFVGEQADAFVGGSTFGAHPVSCAVALANLAILERDGLVENADTTGAYLGEQLDELTRRNHIVAATRGVGLMRQIDLMQDPDAGLKFKPEHQLGKRVPRLLRAHGLLTRGADVIHIAPPLSITRPEVDELVERLDGVVRQLAGDLGVR